MKNPAMKINPKLVDWNKSDSKTMPAKLTLKVGVKVVLVGEEEEEYNILRWGKWKEPVAGENLERGMLVYFVKYRH